MKKALKIFGIVVGVIIVLIIAAVLILPHVINPNDYRDDIERTVKNKTGRTLTITGDIKLSLFPWLGVDVGQASLGNAPGFGNRPMATIQDMEVRVRLLSLLFGPTEIGNLKLDGLTLDLERDAAGKTNWQDLLEHGKQPARQQPGKKGGLANAVIDSIELSNATIDWRDAVAKTEYHLRNVNLTVGKVQAGEPFPLKANFALDSVQPVLHANLGLAATVIAVPAAQQYRLANGTLEINARGAGLPVQPTHVASKWQTLTVDLGAGTFALDSLTLKTLGLEADATLKGNGLNAAPRITGNVEVPDFAPRTVLEKMGHRLQPQDPKVLRHASLSADIDASRTGAMLQNVAMTLDDTHINGQIGIKSFKTGALTFALSADALDADRYLPAVVSKAGKVAQPTSFDHMRLPAEKLRGLNVDGRLTVGSFKLLNLKASNISLGIAAANGEATLNPLSAQLYGGTYSGSIKAAAVGKAMKLVVDQRLAKVELGPLINDFLGKKLISGTADLNIAFNGAGDTVGALKQTLDGKFGFDIKRGAVDGIDLWSAIRRAYAVIKHQPAPKQTGPEKTEFVALNGNGVIHHGVLDDKTLIADLPFMRIDGHGSIDLVRQSVDYRLNAKIIKIPEIDNRGDLAKIKGKTVPIHIEGDFNNLTAFPDLADLLKQRLEDKLKSKLKDKLKGLFNPPRPLAGGVR